MTVTERNDPYIGLMNAIANMKATGMADNVTIEACERVLSQIRELQIEAKHSPNNIAKSLLGKNPFRD